MPFAAEIVDQPEIVAGTLPVPVDFHGGRAGFNDDRELFLGLGPEGTACKSVPQLSESCPEIQMISVIL